MNHLLIVMTLFAGGSMLGWVIELFFRRYLDPVERLKKRFSNPGFLVGPCLPIYGTGLVALYCLAHIRIPALEASHPILHKLVVFLFMAMIMTFIEFVTGMIFIVHMHLELWDYTPYWGNIKGVICPLFSCFWYALAAFYYMVMHPRVEAILNWISQNLTFSFFIGFFYGIFVLDVVYSFNVVVRIKKLAEEYHIVVRYRALRSKVQDLAEDAKDRSYAFMLSKFTTNSLRSMFANYRENFSVKRMMLAPIKAVSERVDVAKDKISDIRGTREVIKDSDEEATIGEAYVDDANVDKNSPDNSGENSI